MKEMGGKVLVVEDEFLVALQLEDLLLDAGHKVVGLVADRPSLARMSEAPQVALVDCNLRDGLTGPTIALDLAREYGTRIVYLTANPQQIATPAATAVGIVQKPFSPRTVLAVVDYALSDDPDCPAPAELEPISRCA